VYKKLLLFFIVLPMVELVLLTLVSYYTSVWTTILFIIGTGILGSWLAHTQGWSTYRRIRQELAQGHMPTAALVDGILILIAGILLISPGVLTDLVGIVLMVPATRRLCRAALIAWFSRHFQLRSFLPVGGGGGSGPPFDSTVVDSYGTDASRSAAGAKPQAGNDRSFDPRPPRITSSE
jgi:UPF0716 protein FxsA